jgi:hypothetical protein
MNARFSTSMRKTWRGEARVQVKARLGSLKRRDKRRAKEGPETGEE